MTTYNEGINAEKPDTVIIKDWLKKGVALETTDPRRAIDYYNKAVEKSIEWKYPQWAIISLTKCGNVYYNLKKPVKAAEKYHQALEVYRQAELDKENIAKDIFPVTIVRGGLNMTLDNNSVVADLYLRLASVYHVSGVKDSTAWYYYMVGKELDKGKINNPGLEIHLYTNLVTYWLSSGKHINKEDLNLAQDYINKALKTASQLHDTLRNISYINFLLGYYHQSASKPDSARYYYLKYLETANRDKSIDEIIITLLNIGDTYLMEEKPAEALAYTKKIRDMNPPEHYLAYADIETAKAHFQQHQYVITARLLDTTLPKLKRMGVFVDDVIESYKIAGDAFANIGQFQKSSAYRNEYILLHDSLMNMQRMETASRLAVLYRLADKDKEIAQKELILSKNKSSIQTKNLWILMITSGMALLLLVGLLMYRNNLHKMRNHQRQLEINHLQDTLNGEEKERKRLARELHDGIGGLLAGAKLNFGIAKNEHNSLNMSPNFKEGMDLLSEAATELRKTAHNMIPDALLDKGLPEAIEIFCDRIKSSHALQIEFINYIGKVILEPSITLSLYRIIQELIHNIIKHAHATEVLIQLSCHNNLFSVIVEDNGTGIGENASLNAGIGLSNVRERLKILNGQLDITSIPGEGTTVYFEFELPVNNSTLVIK